MKTLILSLLTFTTFAQSHSKVLDVLIRCKVSHPRMVMRQAILESGHFSSDICKENHNLFGFKLAKQRPTTATGTNRNHATYNHWIDSIIDYKIWQDKYFKGGDYLLFLKKIGYATDKNYIYKLKTIKL